MNNNKQRKKKKIIDFDEYDANRWKNDWMDSMFFFRRAATEQLFNGILVWWTINIKSSQRWFEKNTETDERHKKNCNKLFRTTAAVKWPHYSK